MRNVTLISMSKVYERENFCRPYINSEKFIDCSDIKGINCYVEDEALKVLRQRLKGVDARGVHFIDSGNFHYLTYLFLEKIPRDFELILIDKHPDCKASMFESLMSCGSWVRDALISISHLKRVYMIGTDTDLVYELSDLGEHREKALVVRSPKKLDESNLPVYMSIDKDVLDDSIIVTNWDQGDMNLTELDRWIEYILDKRFLIGVDICGEPDEGENDSVHEESSIINSHLMELFEN